MFRTTALFLALALLQVQMAWAGNLQNVDFATAAQITGAGGTVAQLLNTSKVFDNVNAQLLNTTIAGKLNLSGGTMSGVLDMGSQQITNLADPTTAQGAATRQYVDDAVADRVPAKDAAAFATTAALPAILYNNGSSGVGATLTGVAAGALSVDGNAPVVGNRILVKNQVSTFQNGIYTVTATGSGIAVFVLTRAVDFNVSADIQQGASIFVVGGSALASTTWVVNSASSPVMGTDPITFVQTSGPGSLTIAALDSQAANATGLAISGSALSTQSADATHPGMVNNTTQTLSGAKTFSSTIVGSINGNAATATALAATPTGCGAGQFANSIAASGNLGCATPAGGSSFTVTAVSSDITLADANIYIVDTTAARTLTFPANVSGIMFWIKDGSGQANTNGITVVPTGNIDGVSGNQVLSANGGSWLFVANGTNWFRLK